MHQQSKIGSDKEIKVMKELNDAQRINNVTVKIVGIETPYDLKKSRT